MVRNFLGCRNFGMAGFKTEWHDSDLTTPTALLIVLFALCGLLLLVLPFIYTIEVLGLCNWCGLTRNKHILSVVFNDVSLLGLYSDGSRWVSGYGTLVKWKWQKETGVFGEIFPSDTWSTTNRTCIGLGLNRGLRGERPAADVLNHGKVTQALYGEWLPERGRREIPLLAGTESCNASAKNGGNVDWLN